MKKKFALLIGLSLLLQTACGESQSSQNMANFGSDKVFPSPENNNPQLTIYLNEYVAAQNRKDYEKIFSLTFPKQIETEGGRESFLAKLTAERGATKDFAYLAGKPTQIISADGKMLAVIPISTKQKIAEGWKFSREIVIGVSEDEGKRWSFASVTDAEKRKILFPTADKLEIPEIKPPWIEK